MANLKVAFYGLDNRGLDKLEGFIIWDGTTIKANPPDSNLLNNIIEIETIAYLENNPKRVSAKNDPENWIKFLYMNYTSAYLRATEAESF